jgi:hypothetical protein
VSNTALIAVLVPLLIALFAGQTFWVARSLDEFSGSLERLRASLDQRFDRIDARLDRIEAKLDEQGQRIARLEGTS